MEVIMGRRCAENKLLMRWCKTEKDINFWFPKNCDGYYLHHVMCMKRQRVDSFTKEIEFENSVIEELEKRGYDIESIRFEIKLKE